MEPLAHTLVGATLAETRLGRLSPLATPTLLIAANLPDLDVLAYAWGADFALGFRRGWTHGVLAMAVMPLLLTGAMLAWDHLRRRLARRRGGENPTAARPGVLLGLAYLGLLTHPFLDWVNNYGIRLLMPFDGRWFYGDALFIVDPWLWLLLGGTVFLLRSASPRSRRAWGALAVLTTTAVLFGLPPEVRRPKLLWLGGLATWGLVRWRLGSPAGRSARHRVACASLALAALYLGLQIASVPLARRAALAALESRGLGPVGHLMVGPLPADPCERQVVAEMPGRLEVGSLFLAGPGAPRLELAAPLASPPISEVVAAARRSPEVQGMLRWMRFPFYVVQEEEGGYTVYLLDARYARTPTTGFGGARVELDHELRPRQPSRR